MVISNRPIVTPGKTITQLPASQKKATGNIGSQKFGEVLTEKINHQSDIKFSKHAEERLNTRNINLNSAQMERIKSGVNKAQEKGVRDSLVLMDNLALVVNIKNRTVVTAANTQELKENVFTNIDGAVIV